ncbi:MAG: hypothetical protein WC455_15445 [Dehalococcoidia bacterium]|jgi:hypothetical protein
MSYGGVVSDLSIVDSSVDIPLMLTRKRGQPVYSETMEKPLNILQNAGLSEDALNPDLNYPVGEQSSWVGGFGEYFFSPSRPRRYLSSYGMDMSVEGAAKLGPKWTAINWPTVATYTLTDGGLETWTSATDLTSWTETLNASAGGASTIARNDTDEYAGTYCAALSTVGGSPAGSAMLSQSLVWNNDFRSKTVMLTAYYYKPASAVGTVSISIYDGVGRTTTNCGATDAWTAATATRTLDATATEFTVELLLTGAGPGDNATIYFDAVTTTGYVKSATQQHYAEFGGYQYMSCGDILFKTDSATAPTSWTYVKNFIADITDLYSGQVSGTSYLWICLGGSNAMQYYNGSSFTACAGTSPNGSYVVSVGGAATDTYWKAETPNIVRSQVAPLAGNWSTATYIGGTDTNITDLLVRGSDLYVIKEDGIYKVNSSGTIDFVAPDLKDFYKAGAGKNSCVKDGKLYVPMGNNALVEYDPDADTWDNISPAAVVSKANASQQNETLMYAAQDDFDGKIFSVTGLGNYLYCLQDNGSTNNLFKGIYANMDGHTGWAWHPVAVTTMGDATSLAASNLSGSEWIWAGQGTGNPGYYDTTHYASTGYFVTAWYTGGVRHIQKSIYNVVCGLQNISADHYYGTLYFQFYGDADWNATTKALNTTLTTGEISNYMPTNSYGRAVRFKILFQTDDADYSPKLNYLKANGKIRNTEIPVIQCTVLLKDNQLMNTGVRDGVSAARKKTAIDNAVASNWPYTLYDIAGTSRTVDMISRTMVQRMRNYQGNPEFVLNLVMQKVTLA